MEPAIFLSAAKIANYAVYAKVKIRFSLIYAFVQPTESEYYFNSTLSFPKKTYRNIIN